MLEDPNAVTHTLFGREIAVNGYFTSVLGAPALNMGVFVGIIAGFVGGVAYNKYYNFRKLPDALAFFNGKRFVPMVGHCLFCGHFHGAGTVLACGPDRHQQLRHLDRKLFRDFSRSGSVHLWHAGASAAALRSAPHADHPP